MTSETKSPAGTGRAETNQILTQSVAEQAAFDNELIAARQAQHDAEAARELGWQIVAQVVDAVQGLSVDKLRMLALCVTRSLEIVEKVRV